ncbi:MAG: hypothetical protein NTY03_09200 [Candidatus Bathyarchaeota archaeon]|nr:hypothetical protein [Candidatus Bathyarchaeota archaeon]
MSCSENVSHTIYMVAATGVLVAAAYYVLNMRATLETRRLGLMDSIATRVASRDGFRDYFELLRYEWKDYEDFERKYGSENNVDGAGKRYAAWNSFNSIGALLRKGILDAKELHTTGVGGAAPFLWGKYKPVIEEVRKRYMGDGFMRDFEYLSGEMVRVTKQKDPSFRFPETLDRYVPDK